MSHEQTQKNTKKTDSGLQKSHEKNNFCEIREICCPNLSCFVRVCSWLTISHNF